MLIFSIINFACSTKEKKIEREPSSTSDYSDNENQFLLELFNIRICSKSKNSIINDRPGFERFLLLPG